MHLSIWQCAEMFPAVRAQLEREQRELEATRKLEDEFWKATGRLAEGAPDG